MLYPHEGTYCPSLRGKDEYSIVLFLIFTPPVKRVTAAALAQTDRLATQFNCRPCSGTFLNEGGSTGTSEYEPGPFVHLYVVVATVRNIYVMAPLL